MSKKINITIPNKVRPNLCNLFHEYLSRKAKDPINEYDWDDGNYEDMINYWDKMFPGWDDDSDDGDVIYPPHSNSNIVVLKPNTKKNSKDKRTNYDAFWSQEEREEQFGKKGKHKHNKKGKKAKMFDISVPYSGDETDPDEYDFDFTTEDYDSESKEIWFYADYHCKDDRMKFSSLKEFSDYCDSMGYWVDKEVASDISWRYESHCCLNPESEKVGLLEIMTAHSYGDMFYDACEESELGD